MKKLTLALDALQVESFRTTAIAKEKGTVHGEQCTCHTACTCPGCPSCDYTCEWISCGGTCDGSCNSGCVDGTCDRSCQISCYAGVC